MNAIHDNFDAIEVVIFHDPALDALPYVSALREARIGVRVSKVLDPALTAGSRMAVFIFSVWNAECADWVSRLGEACRHQRVRLVLGARKLEPAVLVAASRAGADAVLHLGVSSTRLFKRRITEILNRAT